MCPSWLGSWNTLGLSPCFPQEEIKLRNKLNFSDTASTCFLVRNIFDSFEYFPYYPYDLYELSKGFTMQFQVFHGGHLSLKMYARNKGNKWYSSSSKGHFHRKYRTSPKARQGLSPKLCTKLKLDFNLSNDDLRMQKGISLAPFDRV